LVVPAAVWSGQAEPTEPRRAPAERLDRHQRRLPAPGRPRRSQDETHRLAIRTHGGARESARLPSHPRWLRPSGARKDDADASLHRLTAPGPLLVGGPQRGAGLPTITSEEVGLDLP